jgi:hypothetical protein
MGDAEIESTSSTVQSQTHNGVVVRWRSDMPAKSPFCFRKHSRSFVIVRVGWCTKRVSNKHLAGYFDSLYDGAMEGVE